MAWILGGYDANSQPIWVQTDPNDTSAPPFDGGEHSDGSVGLIVTPVTDPNQTTPPPPPTIVTRPEEVPRDPRLITLDGHEFFYDHVTGVLRYPPDLTPTDIRLLLNKYPSYGIPHPWDLEDPVQVAYLKAVEENSTLFGFLPASTLQAFVGSVRGAVGAYTLGLSEIGTRTGEVIGSATGNPDAKLALSIAGSIAGAAAAQKAGLTLTALTADPAPAGDLGSVHDAGDGVFYGDDGGTLELIGDAAKDTLEDSGGSLGNVPIPTIPVDAAASVATSAPSAGASLGSFLPQSLGEAFSLAKNVLGIGITAAGIVQAFTGGGPSPARTVQPSPTVRPVLVSDPGGGGGNGGTLYYLEPPAMGRGSIGTVGQEEVAAPSVAPVLVGLAAAAGLYLALSKS